MVDTLSVIESGEEQLRRESVRGIARGYRTKNRTAMNMPEGSRQLFFDDVAVPVNFVAERALGLPRSY